MFTNRKIWRSKISWHSPFKGPDPDLQRCASHSCSCEDFSIYGPPHPTTYFRARARRRRKEKKGRRERRSLARAQNLGPSDHPRPRRRKIIQKLKVRVCFSSFICLHVLVPTIIFPLPPIEDDDHADIYVQYRTSRLHLFLFSSSFLDFLPVFYF